MNKIPLLVILGPTATGKSDLAVNIAFHVKELSHGFYTGAEIISADSRQVYKGLDIGTGKITKLEMKGVKHHLLDVCSPRKIFDVIQFKKFTENAISKISENGKLPIICGGTGFYIDAVVNNINFTNVQADQKLREKLSELRPTRLLSMLQKLDPVRAAKLNTSDSKNPVRLIRAIEIAKGLSKYNRKVAALAAVPTTTAQAKEYEPIYIGLQLDRETLTKRIANRLMKRIDNGMIEEAINLHKPMKAGGVNLSWKRMEALGLEYRYLARLLQNKISKEEMITKLNTEINRYAKRQMTWFKRNEAIHWFKPGQDDEILKFLRTRI
ncbi:MAG: tRNA (adenosine(37)-N6)-dimethylallyltransferase MiaA [Candidatus Taylorbacteria bacterium]